MATYRVTAKTYIVEKDKATQMLRPVGSPFYPPQMFTGDVVNLTYKSAKGRTVVDKALQIGPDKYVGFKTLQEVMAPETKMNAAGDSTTTATAPATIKPMFVLTGFYLLSGAIIGGVVSGYFIPKAKEHKTMMVIGSIVVGSVLVNWIGNKVYTPPPRSQGHGFWYPGKK